MPIITLTTDYGARDHYAAVLKGVILSVAPGAQVVDLTHDLEPQDVTGCAFVLRQAWTWFPVETTHVAVVDPGVGSGRRILLGRYAGRYVIAPDNGVITFVHRELPLEAMHVVENRRFFLSPVSSTFHGRDIMAPVAAHLASGVNPREFGRTTDRIELLDLPVRAVRFGHGFQGRVLHVDRFGTLVSNVHSDQLLASSGSERIWRVSAGDVELGPIRQTFSDAAVGDALALIGSSGYVEVAVRQGRAIDRFGRDVEIRAY